MKRPLLLLSLLAFAAGALAQVPATNAVVQIPMEAFEKDADWRSFVPAGFTVSPADAHLELGQSWMISLKVRFVCYADDRYYYFGDAFAREPSREQVLKGQSRRAPRRNPTQRAQSRILTRRAQRARRIEAQNLQNANLAQIFVIPI